MSPPFSFILLLFLFLFLSIPPPSSSEIHTTTLYSDPHSIIPLDEFGFTHFGSLDLSVSSLELSASPSDLSGLGFFLSTRDAWLLVLQQLLDRDISCPLHSNLVLPVFTFNRLRPNSTTSFSASLNVTHPAQFTLLFANCLPPLLVSMKIHSSMYNLNPRSNRRSYLSFGSTSLPRIYFLLFLAYSALLVLWTSVLLRNRDDSFRIHYFMLSLLVLKALNLLAEAEDKSYINRTGTAHGWDVLFYFFSLLKGVTLFTVIVLIGTGWSFLKPFLQDKEKKVLIIVIPLQVVANMAQIFVDETGPFETSSIEWGQFFLLVDLICCCAVLFPIVWSIRNLREAARTDGKAAVNLMKLMLFRKYYIVVIFYIYFTRVVVYALVTITSYRYLWTSVVAQEVVTLAFYVFTGYSFRPKIHNPYFVLDDEEEEAAALELSKIDDEFEL